MKMTNRIALYVFLLGLILSWTHCSSTDSDPSENVDSPSEITPIESNGDLVQAILKIQDMDYDHSRKSEVITTYSQRSQINVPPNLGPQNKWVMFEGPVLENDKIAYRFYMDHRHRNDIYGKRVSDRVMDTVGWNYHIINDWGSDILKVNQSLGVGSPGIYYQDSLYTFSEYDSKQVAIVADDEESATVRTTFKGLRIEDHRMDIVQDWSLEAGSPASTIELEVTAGEWPEGMYFATGIVAHLPDWVEKKNEEFTYGYTWGKQSFHEENMGMGLILPNSENPTHFKNRWSHTYYFATPSPSASYQFLAAWERDVMAVSNAVGFEQLIESLFELL